MTDNQKMYAILGAGVLVLILVFANSRGSGQYKRGPSSIVPIGSGGDTTAILSAERIAHQSNITSAFESLLGYGIAERGLQSEEYKTKLETKLANRQGKRDYQLAYFQSQIAERLGTRQLDSQDRALEQQAAAERRSSWFGFITDIFAPFAALF